MRFVQYYNNPVLPPPPKFLLAPEYADYGASVRSRLPLPPTEASSGFANDTAAGPPSFSEVDAMLIKLGSKHLANDIILYGFARDPENGDWSLDWEKVRNKYPDFSTFSKKGIRATRIIQTFLRRVYEHEQAPDAQHVRRFKADGNSTKIMQMIAYAHNMCDLECTNGTKTLKWFQRARAHQRVHLQRLPTLSELVEQGTESKWVRLVAGDLPTSTVTSVPAASSLAAFANQPTGASSATGSRRVTAPSMQSVVATFERVAISPTKASATTTPVVAAAAPQVTNRDRQNSSLGWQERVPVRGHGRDDSNEVVDLRSSNSDNEAATQPPLLPRKKSHSPLHALKSAAQNVASTLRQKFDRRSKRNAHYMDMDDMDDMDVMDDSSDTSFVSDTRSASFL